MEEWKTYKLGQIARIQTGPFGSQLHQSDYVDEGIPCIMPVNIGNWLSLLPDGIAKVTEDDANRLLRHRVKAGDIVYSRRGDIERCAFISKEQEGWLCGTGCLRVCDFAPGINPQFVAYFLSLPTTRAWLVSNAVGTTMLNLNTSILSEILLTIPDYDTQNKIVGIVDSLDSKIELNNRINHNLEEQAQALYKSWFIDFEPFKDGKFVESELGMIPEGWRVGSIYEYTKVIYGAPYKSSLFNEVGDGLPLIRIRDLKDCSPQFFSPEVLPNTEFVSRGDIVAGMDADFTPYIWQGNKGLLNQRVCKFVPVSDSISRYYIMMLVKPELEFVSSYKVGTTVSHLGKNDIDRFTVLIPPHEIVAKYSSIVDSILEQIINNATESARLKDHRDTLLPQLMSGELNC